MPRYDIDGTHFLQVGSSTFPVVQTRFEVPTMLAPNDELKKTEFGKAILSWPKTDVDPSDPVFSTPFKDDSVKRFGFSTAEKGTDPNAAPEILLRTQTELLEKFNKLTGISVVADGFRVPLASTLQDPTGATAADWLKSLEEHTGAFVRMEDGLAEVRQGGFWRLQKYEVPESTLEPLEEAAKADTATLQDYASFFYALTPAQARGFQATNPSKTAIPIANPPRFDSGFAVYRLSAPPISRPTGVQFPFRS